MGVHLRTGMPFGFLPESAFTFAGIRTHGEHQLGPAGLLHLRSLGNNRCGFRSVWEIPSVRRRDERVQKNEGLVTELFARLRNAVGLGSGVRYWNEESWVPTLEIRVDRVHPVSIGGAG